MMDKTTMKYTLSRLAKTSKLMAPSTAEGVEQLELPYIAGGRVNWYNLSGKQFGNMLSRP